MNNNTVKDLDSCGNKRKRSLKENEGKTSQKKTLLSYFQSPKYKEPENGTEIQSEMPVSDDLSSTLMAEEKTSENGESENNNKIVFEKIEHEENDQEIQQNGFELKSSVNGSENLNETDAKSDVSSDSLTSTSETKTGEELQDDEKSIDEFKNPVNANQEHVNTNQEVLQVASQSTSAISENKVPENVNGIEIEPYAMEIQISTSTLEEKANENNDFHDNEQIVDVNIGPDMNQIYDAVKGTGNLNEIEVKPGPSRASQASTSGENSSDTEDNQENIERIDEEKEPEDLNHLSSPSTSKPKSAITDWRSSCYDVASLPNKARKEGLFTDIKFVMGDGEKRKEFHAHKSILACASPVFEEMFFGPSPDERTVIETDDDPDAFEMLLDYIYKEGWWYLWSQETLASVCKFSMISNKYLVPGGEKTVKNFMSYHDLTENDFWDVFQANNFDVLWPAYRDKLESFIIENAKHLVSSENFLKVPEAILNCILQMSKINVEEYPLLLAVTKWVYHNKNQVTSKILMEYYKHIRFAILPSYKLIEFIDSYPEALDAETYLQILQYVYSPSDHTLPKWCSTSKMSRVQELERSKHGPKCLCSECNDSSEDDVACIIQ